jgi:hypothetical protein
MEATREPAPTPDVFTVIALVLSTVAFVMAMTFGVVVMLRAAHVLLTPPCAAPHWPCLPLP